MDSNLHKHRCRICSRDFATGRSLGGHMRSHFQASKLQSSNLEINNTNNNHKKQQPEFRSAGYELRENPRKTCRLSDFIEEDVESPSKRCCGGFPSWNALFDDMIKEDLAISLMMLSRGSIENSFEGKLKGGMNGGYQCGTCKKRFKSYHALGGHRAGHKRIKSCCLVKSKGEDEEQLDGEF